MNEAKILSALQRKYEGALNVAAMTINTLSDSATPVWRGNLRDAKSVRVNSWNDVDVITGGSDVAGYVAKQYGLIDGKESPLRHEGQPESGYKDLSQGGANGGGAGDSAQYSRQYKRKREDGTLQPSVAKWYHRVIQDAESMHQVLTVFMQRFKQ
jgi:hypothetical protein